MHHHCCRKGNGDYFLIMHLTQSCKVIIKWQSLNVNKLVIIVSVLNTDLRHSTSTVSFIKVTVKIKPCGGKKKKSTNWFAHWSECNTTKQLASEMSKTRYLSGGAHSDSFKHLIRLHPAWKNQINLSQVTNLRWVFSKHALSA